MEITRGSHILDQHEILFKINYQKSLLNFFQFFKFF